MSMANHKAAINFAESVTGLRGQVYKSYENQIYIRLPNRGVISAKALSYLKRVLGRVKYDSDLKGSYYGRDMPHGRVVLHRDMRGALTLRIFNHKFAPDESVSTEISVRGSSRKFGTTLNTII